MNRKLLPESQVLSLGSAKSSRISSKIHYSIPSLSPANARNFTQSSTPRTRLTSSLSNETGAFRASSTGPRTSLVLGLQDSLARNGVRTLYTIEPGIWAHYNLLCLHRDHYGHVCSAGLRSCTDDKKLRSGRLDNCRRLGTLHPVFGIRDSKRMSRPGTAWISHSAGIRGTNRIESMFSAHTSLNTC